MCDYAVAQGVPATDIIVEAEACDSIENALYVSPLLMQMGVRDVVLVTSKFHVPRMKHYFEFVLTAFAALNHATAAADVTAKAAAAQAAAGIAGISSDASSSRYSSSFGAGLGRFTGHDFRLAYVGAEDGYTDETRQLRLRKEELLIVRSRHVLISTARERVCPVPCHLRRDPPSPAKPATPATPAEENRYINTTAFNPSPTTARTHRTPTNEKTRTATNVSTLFSIWS
jgi:hypothetical protein